MKKTLFSIAMISCLMAVSAYAIDKAAMDETNPPAASGPLDTSSITIPKETMPPKTTTPPRPTLAPSSSPASMPMEQPPATTQQAMPPARVQQQPSSPPPSGQQQPAMPTAPATTTPNPAGMSY